jgi:hypothetical protein
LENNPFGSTKAEGQFIINPNDAILLDYNASIMTKNITKPQDFKIATYVHDYKKGKVIDLGIYSSS